MTGPRRITAGQMVLHIPDLHAPFMHPDAAAFIAEAMRRFKPTMVVLAGDELDQHSISDHIADPNGYSPGHELSAGLQQLSVLYAFIKHAFICESNHGQRPFRRAFKCGIPREYLRTYHEYMKAPPGWQWGSEIVIDGVRYTHGEEATGQNGALQLAIRMGMNQAVGHWHGNAGASFFCNGKTTLFGLYSGCLVDDKAYAFAYGKTAKNKPVLGVSIIENGVPRFIPMPLKYGRWTGKLCA